MSFTNCTPSLHIYNMPLSTQLLLSILHPKRKSFFPLVRSISWITIIPSITQTSKPESHPFSYWWAIQVLLTSRWLAPTPGLAQSYLNSCRTPLTFSPLSNQSPFKAILHSVSKLTFPSPTAFRNFSQLKKINPKWLGKTYKVLALPSSQPHLPLLAL